MSIDIDIILQTEELTKVFRGFVAVKRVNLRVRRETIHALIGPNGAGKTTCFNLLTKFLNPSQGRIHFKNKDITSVRPADVARLGSNGSGVLPSTFGAPIECLGGSRLESWSYWSPLVWPISLTSLR